jgi:hypothetical protein
VVADDDDNGDDITAVGRLRPVATKVKHCIVDLAVVDDIDDDITAVGWHEAGSVKCVVIQLNIRVGVATALDDAAVHNDTIGITVASCGFDK